jgi:hypothetical protein
MHLNDREECDLLVFLSALSYERLGFDSVDYVFFHFKRIKIYLTAVIRTLDIPLLELYYILLKH